MKKIKQEVEQYMTGLASEGQTLTSRFVFPEEFVGFQGHFPEKKILPGVCQIQCVLTTLEKANKRAVILTEIVTAKYLTPVVPGDEVVCTCGGLQEQEKDGEFLVKALIGKGDTKVSEFKLRLRFAAGGNGQRT